MGSRGSEYDVSNTIASKVHNNEPDDTAVIMFRDLDYSFTEGKWQAPEPEVGFGGSSKAANASDGFAFVPYEHYIIGGNDYYRVNYNGKEYIFDYNGWDNIGEKIAKDNGMENFEMLDDDFETMQDAINHAQKIADKEYEDYLEDPSNFIDDSPYNHSKVHW